MRIYSIGKTPFLDRLSKKLFFTPQSIQLKKDRLEFSLACSLGDISKMENLINKVDGLDWVISMPMRDLRTPLSVAVEEEQVDVVHWLLNHGAKVHIKPGLFQVNFFQASFMIFSHKNYRLGKKLSDNSNDILDLLIEFGLGEHINELSPNVEKTILRGSTFLYKAMYSENPKNFMIKLIKAGASLDIKNKNGSTCRNHMSMNLRTWADNVEFILNCQNNLEKTYHILNLKNSKRIAFKKQKLIDFFILKS